MRQEVELNALKNIKQMIERRMQETSSVVWKSKGKYLDHLINALAEIEKARNCMKEM